MKAKDGLISIQDGSRGNPSDKIRNGCDPFLGPALSK
jgi:hypothetical protein